MDELGSLSPYQEVLTNLGSITNEARGIIRRYLDDKIDATKLNDMLMIDIAPPLESVLNSHIGIARPKHDYAHADQHDAWDDESVAEAAGRNDDNDGVIIDDFEELSDRLFTNLRDRGHHLYYVLLSAA